VSDVNLGTKHGLTQINAHNAAFTVRNNKSNENGDPNIEPPIVVEGGDSDAASQTQLNSTG
jgi:hypothetical protein